MMRISKILPVRRNTLRMMSTPCRSPSSRMSIDAISALDFSRSRRNQHQLVAVDCQHREAMRLFLDSLNAAAVTFPTATVAACAASHDVSASLRDIQSQPWESNFGHSQNSSTNNIRVDEIPDPTTITIEKTGKNEQSAPTNSTNMESLHSENHVTLGKAIRRRQTKIAFQKFEQAVDRNKIVPIKMVADLFYLMVKKDPILSFELLQYYNAHPDAPSFSLDMYRRLCYSVSLVDPQKHRPRETLTFVESLLADLEELDLETKLKLYPPLTVSLAKQRSVGIGPYAGYLYNFLVENGFSTSKGWLQSLLALSKYNRQEDLPFHDILARLVSINANPHPFSVLPAIQNMFPYTDTGTVYVALEAYRDLQRQSLLEERNASASLYQEHVMDLAALEMISAGAAHSGNSKLVMLVWDILEQSNISPTAAVYENTVVAFASEPGDDLRQTFHALMSMKEDGFIISRPLIRSVSLATRCVCQCLRQTLRSANF